MLSNGVSANFKSSRKVEKTSKNIGKTKAKVECEKKSNKHLAHFRLKIAQNWDVKSLSIEQFEETADSFLRIGHDLFVFDIIGLVVQVDRWLITRK